MNLKSTSENQERRYSEDFPFQVLMESTSACQLRCAMCARKDALKSGRFKIGTMTRELAVKIIDEIADEAPDTRLWLCYFGEPLLCKDLSWRIAYAKDRGIITTIINSNGNLLTPENSAKLIKAGLDEIYVGIDAVTPGTYSKIRVRGNYDRVVDNVLSMTEKGRGKLKISVQFGVYDENEHEVKMFEEFWKGKGIHIFIRPKLTWINTLPEKTGVSRSERYSCPWILDCFPIYFDGVVPYCICDWYNRKPLGNVTKSTIKELWQGPVRKIQRLHLEAKWDKLPDFCQTCPDWKTKPLEGKLKDWFEKYSQ